MPTWIGVVLLCLTVLCVVGFVVDVVLRRGGW